MKAESSLRFKIASEDEEFEAIHRLNYSTFVEEIPQHATNPEHRLVDKFHAENTYAVCFHDGRLVGMVAGRGARPFSLDQKVPDLDSHLPAERRVLEVRLLSVKKGHRNGFVFSRLVGLLAQHFKDLGYDLAIISGTVRQQRLYKHLGFVPFGPVVGAGEAQFQPMYLTLEKFLQMAKALSPPSNAVETILDCYLPGPVGVHEEVRAAFNRGPVSHRSDGFMADFRATKGLLCGLTKAQKVEILLGSGTLANDAVSGQLSLLGERGLVLSNGEFGERLVDHATRQGLRFEVCQVEWGEPFDYDEIRWRLRAGQGVGWVWLAHCETSTGILNELATLKEICREAGVKLCLDCISSIGTVPVDLRDVYLASCVSGKALASYPGLSMVFYNHVLEPAPRALPRYLDLGLYASHSGIAFTQSSNLVFALQTALHRICWEEKYEQTAAASRWLREELRRGGLELIGPDGAASPAVVTIALPGDLRSADVGQHLRGAGYLLSYKSAYLLRRNWIQICLMGEWSMENLEILAGLLVASCGRKEDRPASTVLQPAMS